ncbi:MAG: GNAT family N-acetyltransferase [Steroidobacter sp.]
MQMSNGSIGSPSRVTNTFDDGLRIVTFDPAYRDEFRRLNVAWLTRYFKVEPIDERVLGNPEAEILASGGEILFALLDGEVVGTVALKREDGGEFELTKMAVDERSQGCGYGKRLLESACALAHERGARRVILYSQRALQPAVSMYFKYGFRELPLTDSRYSRCDIKMERMLG